MKQYVEQAHHFITIIKWAVENPIKSFRALETAYYDQDNNEYIERVRKEMLNRYNQN